MMLCHIKAAAQKTCNTLQMWAPYICVKLHSSIPMDSENSKNNKVTTSFVVLVKAAQQQIIINIIRGKMVKDSTQTGVGLLHDVETSAAKECWDASSTWYDDGIPAAVPSDFHHSIYSTSRLHVHQVPGFLHSDWLIHWPLLASMFNYNMNTIIKNRPSAQYHPLR